MKTKNSASLPIAVFDSGVGGLTVLHTLQKYLPNESFLYLGDMARVPYGTKSPAAITRYTHSAADYLIRQDIKLLVIACHTASTLALPTIEKLYNEVPMVGMIEPGAQAACQASKQNHVAVIATEATVQAQGYQKAIQRIRPEVKVSAQACSLFVALAEEGWTHGMIAEATAQQYLSPLFAQTQKPDCLLLGCTHFPLLTSAIKNVIGNQIQIIDPAVETAHIVKRILQEKSLLASAPSSAHTQFLVTDSPERFARVAQQFLATQVLPSQVKLVELVEITA